MKTTTIPPVVPAARIRELLTAAEPGARELAKRLDRLGRLSPEQWARIIR